MKTIIPPVPMENIAQRILLIRGRKVMLDSDLAELFEVDTKALVQAVKRNIERFPEDFMFQLSESEFAALRSQFVTSNRGGRRYAPYVFTEHGTLMLGNILRSSRAVEVSLLVVRTFIQLREILASHQELAAKLEAMEHKIGSHDQAIAGLIDALRQLMATPEKEHRPIGFTVKHQ